MTVQPIGASRSSNRGLHLSEEDLQVVKPRAAAGVPLLAMRFTHDRMCPGERFERLREELGTAFEAIEIDSSPRNAAGIPRTAHSVVRLR